MKKTIKCVSFVLFLMAGTILCAQSPRLIATNGWTAAFAELAGADNMEVLAPYDMKHPPEYEISLAELQKVSRADFLVFAGYETMMKRIKESMGDSSSVTLIQVDTVNSYPVIAASVRKIAGELGTVEAAEANLAELKSFLDDWKRELVSEDLMKNIIVHFHQQGPAKSLGLEPAMVFGPAPASLNQIRDVLGIKPSVIIDNYHNPQAAPFLEQTPAPAVVQWINFPGTAGTRSLLDVMKYNREQLDKILN